jgi:hypothetical protein
MTINELKNKVQAHLNDRKAANRLLGYEYEYTEEAVTQCAGLALEEINYKGVTTTKYTIETCDPYLLRLGTAKYLLSQEIATKGRNYAAVNDGGISINREGNIEFYYRMYEAISTEFEEQLYAKKNARNLMRGYGH